MTGNKYLIIIAGPTASGKTDLAVDLAEMLGTEIISADSRQVYREMKTGTAFPSPSQLVRVRHHLAGHISVHDKYNASIFENEALALLEQIFRNHDTAVMAGGSGLYIDAVCRGIDDLPSISREVREAVKNLYHTGGLESIRERLQKVDNTYYERVDLNNPSRILKALEVNEMTGRPYSSFLTGPSRQRAFKTIKAGIGIERKMLHERINRRVDTMIENGLVEEALSLYPLRDLNALNTVGYKELFTYFDGSISLEEAVEQIKSHTRQYARRQMTWFRKDSGIKWFDASAKDEIFEYVMNKIKDVGTA